MKIYIFPILIAFFALSFSACQEVIDIDLNEAEPALVVDAKLDVDTRNVVVNLTRTTSYFANEPFTWVTDATVTVAVNGNVQSLVRQMDGIYEGPITVVEGDEVTLSITEGSEVFTSTTIVPGPILPDSLTTEFFDPNAFFDGGSIVRINFQEPADVGNWIRVKLWANGEEYTGSDNIVVENDLLSDGQYIDYPVFLDFFQPGDSITVVLQSITESTYDYFLTLQDITQNQGGGNTAAPANPITNIQGGGLGLFDIHHADTLSIIIP